MPLSSVEVWRAAQQLARSAGDTDHVFKGEREVGAALECALRLHSILRDCPPPRARRPGLPPSWVGGALSPPFPPVCWHAVIWLSGWRSEGPCICWRRTDPLPLCWHAVIWLRMRQSSSPTFPTGPWATCTASTSSALCKCCVRRSSKSPSGAPQDALLPQHSQPHSKGEQSPALADAGGGMPRAGGALGRRGCASSGCWTT